MSKPKTNEEVLKALKSMQRFLDTLDKENASDVRRAQADGYIRALKWFLDMPLF